MNCVSAIGIKRNSRFHALGLAGAPAQANPASAAGGNGANNIAVLACPVHLTRKVITSGAMEELASNFLNGEALDQQVDRHTNFDAPACGKRLRCGERLARQAALAR